ncbi:MAG: efflux RND transporter periplasmic adaptor subunit, partial [Burkholderiales bacterium]|nr:efflux RND transporter periplasmic adaptor subunit [Opitutaceae bacterium]
MSFRPSRLIFPLVVIVAAAGAFYWWRDRQQPEPVSFNTVKVARGTLTQSITATGDLQPV